MNDAIADADLHETDAQFIKDWTAWAWGRRIYRLGMRLFADPAASSQPEVTYTLPPNDGHVRFYEPEIDQ